MAATIGLFAASMAWIIGISGGPDILVPNSLMSAPVIKKMKLRMLSRGFKQWLQSECHGAVPFQEMRQRRDKRAHWWHFTSQSNNEIVWCGICVSIVKWHETEKKKKKKIMSIPPQNIPFWPQMTTDFTFGSLSALSTVPTMPCLTAALYKKRIQVFTWHWIF